MKNIVAFGASSSNKSINKTLAIYVAERVSEASITIVDLQEYMLPLFGMEVEEENGVPQGVHQFSEIIASADGLVVSLAEHNGTYTAVFKNLLDWLSRIDMKVWKGKPMILLATSPGRRGGASVLSAAKSYFPFMEGNIVADFSLPSFYENFSSEGIVNKELSKKLDDKIVLFEQALKEN